MRRSTPRIKKINCPGTVNPEQWAALWSDMATPTPGWHAWLPIEDWARRSKVKRVHARGLIEAAWHVGLLRRRVRSSGLAYFARVDVVAYSWSAREELAFDKTSWRWQEDASQTC